MEIIAEGDTIIFHFPFSIRLREQSDKLKFDFIIYIVPL